MNYILPESLSLETWPYKYFHTISTQLVPDPSDKQSTQWHSCWKDWPILGTWEKWEHNGCPVVGDQWGQGAS